MYDIELVFFQNTLLFVEIYQLSHGHFGDKENWCHFVSFLTIITRTTILKMLLFFFNISITFYDSHCEHKSSFSFLCKVGCVRFEVGTVHGIVARV